MERWWFNKAWWRRWQISDNWQNKKLALTLDTRCWEEISWLQSDRHTHGVSQMSGFLCYDQDDYHQQQRLNPHITWFARQFCCLIYHFSHSFHCWRYRVKLVLLKLYLPTREGFKFFWIDIFHKGFFMTGNCLNCHIFFTNSIPKDCLLRVVG